MIEQADLARLCCPRCRSTFADTTSWRCSDLRCTHATEGFPTIDGRPVLVDFADSVFDRGDLLGSVGASPISRRRYIFRVLRERLSDDNDAAPRNCAAFVEHVRAMPSRRVLIVGGGACGSGTEALYEAEDLRRIVTDVYVAPDVDLLADGHRLPFVDGTFDGVWIQAVLEHVVDPDQVVGEITRVLAPGGLVYAETPFLQHVHERAYDFTRFTRSGHRWLFRHFEELASGPIGGPGQSLVWSIRYLARGLFRSDKAGSLAALAFFWLRYLDRLVDDAHRSDAATGVYFLGRKSAVPLHPKALVDYFPGVRGI